MNTYPICRKCGKEQNIPYETSVLMCDDPESKVENTTIYTCQCIIDSINNATKVMDDIIELYKAGIIIDNE